MMTVKEIERLKPGDLVRVESGSNGGGYYLLVVGGRGAEVDYEVYSPGYGRWYPVSAERQLTTLHRAKLTRIA